VNDLPALTNQRFAIFGLQGSGKSYLAKKLLSREPRSLVYDVMDEYQGFNRYIVKYRQYEPAAISELDTLVNKIVIGSGKIRCFVLDEANRFCPPKPHPLPASILDLNDGQRHYNIAFGVIARRPTQLHSDLTELAHWLFIFNLPGKNDQSYMDELKTGLGDIVAGLPEHQFVILDQRRNVTVHEAI